MSGALKVRSYVAYVCMSKPIYVVYIIVAYLCVYVHTYEFEPVSYKKVTDDGLKAVVNMPPDSPTK